MPGSPHVAGHSRDEADLEDVVLVRGEGELAFTLDILSVEEVVGASICHHHVHLKDQDRLSRIMVRLYPVPSVAAEG